MAETAVKKTRTTRSKTKTSAVKETAAATVKKEPRKYEMTDLIPCVSVFPGIICFGGQRSALTYYFYGAGEESEIEYQDLIPEIRNKNSNFIYEPQIVIKDEDLLDRYPDLRKVYDKLYPIDEIERILLSGDINKVRDMLTSMSDGMKRNASNIIASMISEGKLDSVGIVREADNILGTKMEVSLSFER